MTKQTIIQQSFSAGEVSPLLHGRYDSEGYSQGCKTLENMFSDPRGPAVSRDGFRHIARIAGNDARTEQIEILDSAFALFVFTDLKLSILSMFGANPAVNFPLSPRFRSGAWNTTIGGEGLVSSRDDSSLISTQAITDIANIYLLTNVTATGNHTIIVHTDGAAQYRVRAGTAPNDGTFYDAITQELEHIATFNLTALSAVITVDVVPAVTPVAVNVRYIGLADDMTPPEFVTLYTEQQLHELQFVAAPDGSKIYVLHPDHHPYEMTYTLATDLWAFNIVTFTGPPGVWGAGNGPATGTVFQGRLWLGGTRDQPNTFWGSVSGSYDDFTPGAGLAGDAVDFERHIFGSLHWGNGMRQQFISHVTSVQYRHT